MYLFIKNYTSKNELTIFILIDGNLAWIIQKRKTNSIFMNNAD